jgi:hypothetical protein
MSVHILVPVVDLAANHRSVLFKISGECVNVLSGNWLRSGIGGECSLRVSEPLLDLRGGPAARGIPEEGEQRLHQVVSAGIARFESVIELLVPFQKRSVGRGIVVPTRRSRRCIAGIRLTRHGVNFRMSIAA